MDQEGRGKLPFPMTYQIMIELAKRLSCAEVAKQSTERSSERPNQQRSRRTKNSPKRPQQSTNRTIKASKQQRTHQLTE
jgi:hypothetical protein